MSDHGAGECVPLERHVALQSERTREAIELARVAMEQRVVRAEEDIRSLRDTRAELAGKASQRSNTVALIIAAAGVVLGSLGFILALATFAVMLSRR